MTDIKTKIVLRRYAMNLGTCMGLFWIAKFVLFPLGLQHSFLLLAYIILTAAVPFIGYRYVAAFRDRVCGGVINFSQACLFLISMYLFASLLVSVAHYIYFAFIDNGYLAGTMNATINAALQISPVSETDRATLEEAMKQLSEMTAADFTLQFLSSDIFFCTLLSVPTALFAMRRQKKVAADEQTEKISEENK